MTSDTPGHDTPGPEARPASVAVLAAAVGSPDDSATVAAALAATVADAEPAQRDALLVAALRAAVPGNAAALQARGLPRTLAEASVADVDRKLDRYGLRGTGVEWLVAVATGRVVAVGRLQFELGDHLPDGSPAWGVHVPETGPLDPDACDRAFARSPEVLRALAPALAAEHWQCRSWILDPGMAAVLGPDANLVRFARRFRLTPLGPHDAAEGDESVAKFVFGVPLATARASAATGRLPRAVLDRWAAGGHWTERTGTVPVADRVQPPRRTVQRMTKPDHDHLDDGVDMTFEERRQDTFRRMSGSDAHDADPRVEVSRAEDGDVRIDVADTAAVRPGGPKRD